MNRHLLALSKVKLVACQLMSHLLNAEASPEERASFSILREDQVVTLECCCSTDTRGFLSKLSHIERNSALSLGCVVYLIGFVDCDHRVVHLEDFSIGNFGVVVGIYYLAVFVHDSETLHFVERAAEVHFGSKLVLE